MSLRALLSQNLPVKSFDNISNPRDLDIDYLISATKKTSNRVRRLTNFPIAETIDEMISALQMLMPDITHAENRKIGCIL